MSKQQEIILKPVFYVRHGETDEQEDFFKEFLSPQTLITYGIAWGPLAACFLFFLPLYIGAFKRNLTAHGASHLLPLCNHSFHTLKSSYPWFIVFAIVSGIFLYSPASMIAGHFDITVATMFGCVLSIFVGMYQFCIAIISIHRFLSNRQPVELRKNLTRKNVIVMMVIAYFITIVKDVGTAIIIIVMLISGNIEMVNVPIFCYCGLYIVGQILLFIGMALQLTMKSIPSTSHFENAIAIHTKVIGAIKLVLGIAASVSYVTGNSSTAAVTMFFNIDLFLVPVVIEITEIRLYPIVIHKSENVLAACEMKQEASNV